MTTTDMPQPHAEQKWILDAVYMYQSQLIHYAKRFLGGDTERAKEIVQDAFLKLCEQPEQKIKNKKSWLYRVVRNRSLNSLKKEKRMVHGVETDDMDRFAASQQNKSNPMVGSGVFELIQTLPDKQSELLLLKFREGLSYKEISDVTGLTTSNVGYILHHAIKALKELWLATENGN